jgi:glycosyltransferase involved in cell wall biosynthesis
VSELTEKLIRLRDAIRNGEGLLLTRADTDALAEAINLLSDAERMRSGLNTLARLVREEYPADHSLGEIARIWGSATPQEVEDLNAVDPEQSK